MSDWQLIKTAPKDGEVVMIWWKGISLHDYPLTASYIENDYVNPDAWTLCKMREYGDQECYPSHWMKLPQPPKDIFK